MGLFNIFSSKEKKRQEYHLHALSELAKSDGNFDDKEYQYILNVAQGYGVTKEKLDTIIEKPMGKDYLPSSNSEKLKLIYDLLSMALVDKHIDRKEQKMVETFAEKMEFPRKKVRELIDSMVENIRHGNPFEETVKRVDFLVNGDKYNSTFVF